MELENRHHRDMPTRFLKKDSEIKAYVHPLRMKILAELAKSLYVGDQVYFTGMLGREASKQALADADIFLLPSLSENFGMAVVEAMLARLPVIISDHVGLAQEISEMSAGVVVPLAAGDEGFSNAISELIDDSPRRKALAESGRVFAKATYSETAVASKMELLLNDIRNGCIE
jgi:glycosyltransferase involved in cell wall biosynthesis